MSQIMHKFKITGDKENSKFFNEYLPKIFDRREASGLDDLLIGIRGLVIQVDHAETIKYLMELYLMTPYRLATTLKNSTHKIFILENNKSKNYPKLFILEPLVKSFSDEFTAIDCLYPKAKEKANARYIGEIFQTKNSAEVEKVLKSQEFRFQNPTDLKNAFLSNENFHVTLLSYFTNNVVIYTDSDLQDIESLNLGEPFHLTKDEEIELGKADEVHTKFELDKLVFGIDHLATRILCNEREDAILEFLCLSNYYFWGAYNIEESNSSTNICRNPNINNELLSPAKVFTANNTPFYVKTINGLPSPTEDFVRNLGKRMHHIAYEVEDGARPDGVKNIDYVVNKLISEKIPFLAQIIGECRDFPDLKQIFSKSSNYSLLITEYVQRCHGFEGFFTKNNVAYLTNAAGEDEKLKS